MGVVRSKTAPTVHQRRSKHKMTGETIRLKFSLGESLLLVVGELEGGKTNKWGGNNRC
jgi:hypothetical protein